MRTYITATVTISVIAFLIVRHIDGRLANVRLDNERILTEAEQLGISLDKSPVPSERRKSRAKRDKEAKELAIAFLALPKARETIIVPSVNHPSDVEKRIAELDTSQLKILITDLLAAMEEDESISSDRVLPMLRNLASIDPINALELFKMYSSVCRRDLEAGNVVSTALGTLAKSDPIAAVDWMKRNAEHFPEALSAQALNDVFNATAQQNPRLALSLIGKLGLDHQNLHSVIHTIVTAPRTDESRNATVAALREYRKLNKDDKELTRTTENMFSYFSWGFAEGGLKDASKWVVGANLTSKELDLFCGGMCRNYDGDEHPGWIEWLGETMPPDKSASYIVDMMQGWTKADHEAAGTWLDSIPEGPTRDAAIKGYAQTLYPYEPEVALEWITSLPPGEQRQNALQYILVNELRNDPEAAKAFAEEHGIE